jgi:signal transduction histidine kinase
VGIHLGRDVVLPPDFHRVEAEAARRELLRQATTTIEEERRHVARELHDETGQSLTALLVGLQAIELARLPGEAATLARRLRAVAAQTLDEVGRLSRGLHPGILEDLGLAEAVTRYAHEFGKLHALAVNFRLVGLDGAALPLAVQSTLYRTLQEALTNVARHSGATQVDVAVEVPDGYVVVRVTDNGRGMSVPAQVQKGGLGMMGMRERADQVAGTLAIESVPGIPGTPGTGTTVLLKVPLV